MLSYTCHKWRHHCHICDKNVVYDFSLTGVPCSDDIGQKLLLFGLYVIPKIRRKFRIPKKIVSDIKKVWRPGSAPRRSVKWYKN